MSNQDDPDFEGPPGTGQGYSSSLRRVLDLVAGGLRAKGVDVDMLEMASAHPYSCTCETCWHWWVTMGLGDEGNAAPFTQAQIDAESYEAAIAMTSEILQQFAREASCEGGVHVWAADPVKRNHYKCATCGLEYTPNA